MYRMRNGQLITNPTDTRDYKGRIENYMKNHPKVLKQGEKMFATNQPTGFAAPIDYSQVSQPQLNFSGYTNPLSGSNRIFTRDEVGSMSNDEYSKYEKEIDAQIKAMNGRMPTNRDLEQEVLIGGVVYVHPYVRQDGTQVSGYYRSLPKI